MSQAQSIRMLITATDDLSAELGRLSFAMEDTRISMGRLWLVLYQNMPWYRRLWSDIRRGVRRFR